MTVELVDNKARREVERAARIARWVKRQKTNPEVLAWLEVNPPPADFDRSPLLWAYENAPEALLEAWSSYGLPKAQEPAPPTEADPDSTPIEAEKPPQAVLAESASPQPLDRIEVPAEADIPSKVSWFDPAAGSEPPTPLVKIPGSKRWIVPALRPAFERCRERKIQFIEPFAGSAAVALAAAATGCHTQVSDANEDLMTLLAACRDAPKQLWRTLEQWVTRGISEEHYLAVRKMEPTTPFERAVRALFLARLSFNGLWRVNKHGQFNVPYGRADSRAFPSLEAIQAVAEVFRNAQIFASDYRPIVARAPEESVLYVDPPYVGTFTAYTAAGWTNEDAAGLAEALREAATRGVSVIISSPSDPEIAAGFSWAHSALVPRKHIVAADPEARVKYPEAIYTNAPQLIDLGALEGS